MMNARLVAGALLIAFLAGCVAEPSSETSLSPSERPTSAPTPAFQANETSSPAAIANTPPSAALNASSLNGSVPFEVVFSLNGTDVDGDELSWVISFGDNGTAANGTGLPATVNHTFETEGNFTVLLNVTDGTDATLANLTILAATGAPAVQVGLPVPDGSVQGSVFAYQSVAGAGVGVSNVVATATGPAGDPVPKYPGGTDVVITARSVTADIDIAADTPATFALYRPDGTIVMGPLEASGSADGSALQFTVGTQTLPTEAGEYLLVFALTVDGTVYYIQDDSTGSGGLRMIEVL